MNTFSLLLEKISTSFNILVLRGESRLPNIMATVCFSDSICKKIDRSIRAFIWGGWGDNHIMHLVNWSSICKPKSQGGLGTQCMSDLNKARVGKLRWHFLQNNDIF
ncbi:hypothetical protein V2J09_003736 [Rumex salicifolius]